MKYCPECDEEFEDAEYGFCTFDGTPLRTLEAVEDEEAEHLDDSGAETSEIEPGAYAERWRIATFITLAALFLIGGIFAVYLSSNRSQEQAVKATTRPAPPEDSNITSGEAPRPVSITELTRDGLLNIIPKNFLSRFQGQGGSAAPDDIRVLTSGEDHYVVMVGSGRRDSSTRQPVERMVVLKREEGEFVDRTRQALPGSFSGGVAKGSGARVALDSGGKNLIIRQSASSAGIIDECPTCEHAYQKITLEWQDSRYVEISRQWDNDRYTALYVVAEALEKRRVDQRARPLIDAALDEFIAQGFSRKDKKGWVVENLTEDKSAPVADYELKNGSGRVLIRVSNVNGRWKAIRVIPQLA
jgi:hypothetical protein